MTARALAAPTWRPLGGATWRADVRRRVAAWMDQLLAAIPAASAAPLDPEHLTLFDGRAGVAVAHACYGAIARDERHAARAVEMFEELGAALGDARLSPALHSGYGGVGWLGRLLARVHGGDDPCGDLDDALAAELAAPDPDRDFDLVWGVAGQGLYALGGATPTSRANAATCVAYLARTATPQPQGGAAWFRPARLLHESRVRRFPDGLYDLGVAHGAAGVVAFLARAIAAGVAVDLARPALAGAMTWLWSLAGQDGGDFVFPSLIAPGPAGPTFPSRFGWCYGDLGVASALAAGARALDDVDSEIRALAIARACVVVPRDERTVRDPWLCHGAAGLGHLFARLHARTGEAAFATAALGWLDRALAIAPAEIAPLAPGDWRPDVSLFDGVAGLALALLAATHDEPPSWDELMMPA